jgi:hypothetical protein
MHIKKRRHQEESKCLITSVVHRTLVNEGKYSSRIKTFKVIAQHGTSGAIVRRRKKKDDRSVRRLV